MNHPSTIRSLRHATIIVAAIICAAGPWAATTRAQGSRKDDVVFNSRGQPLAGATVRVCTATATTTPPCTPLALIYSDVAMTQSLANPIHSDGMGNYNFYAAPGRYVLEISDPAITTRQVRDVILPNDPSQPTSFSSITTSGNISGFTLSLAGNLTVAGSAAVTGSLTVGGAPVPSTAQANTWTASQSFKGPVPWRDVTAFGAKCDAVTDDTAAFQAAFNAALADPGGTVYIPWNSPVGKPGTNYIGCVISGGITIPPHDYWLNVIQVGNITIPTGGGPLIDSGTGFTDKTMWLGLPGQGGGVPQSFGEPSSPTILVVPNVSAFHLHANEMRFENLDVRCGGSTTTDCINCYSTAPAGFADITLANVNAVTATGSTGAALNFDCSLAASIGNGCFSLAVLGGVYGVANTASQHASIIFRDCGAIMVGTPDRRMNLQGYGILIQEDGLATAGSGLVHVQNILTEAMNGPLVTAFAAGAGGNGIADISIDRSDVADCSGTCSIFYANSAGTAGISGVSITNSSGANLFAAGTNHLTGCMASNNIEVYTTHPLPSFPCDIALIDAGIHYFTGISAASPALAVNGSLLVNIDPTTLSGDAALHVVDNLNGGNGISPSSFTNAIACFDSAASSQAVIPFESANGANFSLQFCRPTGGCAGNITYVHPNGFAIVAESQTEMYVGDPLGGVSIRRGLNFLNGGSNALTFGGSFSAAQTQSFQDASGTIALTNQLPLAGTTSSIGGSALAAGVCTTGTASVTSSATSMAVAASPATDPGTGFTWNGWVSAAGTVTVRVCNISSASATPTASAYNVRVIP